MPIGIIPIAASTLSAPDVIRGLCASCRGSGAVGAYAAALTRYSKAERAYLLNSGTNSLFVAFCALAQSSSKKEVLLPAYSSSVLVAAALHAGLMPRLYDINLDDLGAEAGSLEREISSNTLCVVWVHLFGIISQAFKEVKLRFPAVTFVEDCAQSFGSRVGGQPAGTIGDISIFSFNRGKNLPTYGGGAVVTRNTAYGSLVEKQYRQIPEEHGYMAVSLACKVMILACITRPFLYGLLTPFIAGLKEQAVHPDFRLRRYTSFQAGVAASLLQRCDDESRRRYQNGMCIRGALKDDDGLLLPKIPDDAYPAFNRFPVLFKDVRRREACRKKLRLLGIEAVPMYPVPLHHLFALGYRRDDFPNAVSFARHHLCLPTHPLVDERALHLIIEALR